MGRSLTIFMLVFLLATPARAETIRVGVNGLVSAFCVKGIESGFRKRAAEALESVQVNLDEKLVTLVTKNGRALDDGTITGIITDAGYTVTGIKREK